MGLVYSQNNNLLTWLEQVWIWSCRSRTNKESTTTKGDLIFLSFFVDISGMGWSPQASSIIAEFAISNWTLVAKPRFILRERNTKKDWHTSNYASNLVVRNILSFYIISLHNFHVHVMCLITNMKWRASFTGILGSTCVRFWLFRGPWMKY